MRGENGRTYLVDTANPRIRSDGRQVANARRFMKSTGTYTKTITTAVVLDAMTAI